MHDFASILLASPETSDVGECTDLDAAQCLAKRDHVVPQFLLAIPQPFDSTHCGR